MTSGPTGGTGTVAARGSAPAPGRPLLRMRPTGALLRAVIAGCAAVAAAVLLGRPMLILVALPLLAWALVAFARRLARGEELGVAGPRMQIGRRTIEEGSSASVSVSTAPGVLTAATFPMQADAEFSPRYGSTAADGSLRLSLSAQRWGRVRVGPVHVAVNDSLGAFRDQLQLPAQDVQVVPSPTVLDAPVEVPTPIGVSGVHLSRRRGDGTALSEVRSFRPGDRLHRINWRVSQRTGELHTNATFTEQDTEVLIVTDTISDVAPAPWAGADAPTSLDMTIRATSAVANHYLTAGDRVSVFDIGHLIGPVRAGTGPRQLRVLTDALARAGRDDRQMRSVRRLRAVRPGTLTVVCTPLLHSEVITQIGELVAHGADVIVVDTLPPSIGDVSVLNGKPLRQDGRISERFWPEAWAIRRLLRRTTVRELREAGVPVTAWEGPSSLAPVLLSLSAARTAPRMRRS